MALVILNATAAPPGRLAGRLAAQGEPRDARTWPLSVTGNNRVLRLKSRKSFFRAGARSGMSTSLNILLLTWSWKVSELPAGGDFRHSSTDDQAAASTGSVQRAPRPQLHLGFLRPQRLLAKRQLRCPCFIFFALVCHSGQEELNQWLPENSQPPPGLSEKLTTSHPGRVKGIRLQINTQTYRLHG